MCTMESEQFFLKWNNFESNLASGFADLLQTEAMVDVTLAAEGKIVQAHKIILSICSSYFRNMFQVNPCQHPIVVLKDVRYQELTDMLDFMYKGEANVRQQDLPSFLKLAQTLEVKGLAGSQEELDGNSRKRSQSQISNLTKDFSFDIEEPSNDVDKELMYRKKTKRCISPVLDTRNLPHSPNVKQEVEKCDNFLRNDTNLNCQNVVIKEERLSDNSLDSYGENLGSESSEVKRPAGPSSIEENCDAVPQDFKFRFNPKRVPIWDFYMVNYDYDIAVCKVCQKIIKTRRKDGTRNVLSHMRNLHPGEYALALQFKEQWKTLKRRQCVDLFKRSFLESCFGGQLLVLNGYSYRRKSVKAERSYWNCCRKKCPAKGILRSDGKFQLSDRNHAHEPEFEDIKKKEKLVELKKLALQLNVSGQNLLQALNINEDVPKHLSFIRTCRRRAKKRSVIDRPIHVGLDYERFASRVGSKEMIFHGGYLYREDSKNPLKGDCKYWRCRLKTCKARAKTDELGNLTVLKVRHYHPPEEIEMNKSSRESGSILPRPLTARTDKGGCSKRVVEKISQIAESATEDRQKPLIEGSSDLGFPPSEPDAETFSLDKLMAETLADCVSTDFADSLLKS